MSNVSGIVSGIFTAVLILLFIGLVAWAWSARRRSTYEAAARLPLEEDNGVIPPADRRPS
jgi:cytochrome c oxidase cbb3-type subunit 4